MSIILKSVFGRLLGLDASSYVTNPVGAKFPEYQVGPSGSEVSIWGSASVQTLTSGTTATAITAGGLTVINSSNTLTWVLSQPLKGVEKRIVCNSTASGAITVRLSSALGANILTSAASTYYAAALTGQAQQITLMGLSTSQFAVVGASTGNVVFST